MGRLLRAFSVLAGIISCLLISHAVYAESGGILLFQPEAKAILPPGKTVLIGRVCGVARGEATLVLEGGKRVPMSLQDGIFFKEIELAAGKNRVQIEFPGARALEVDLTAGDNSGYRSHISNMVCNDCHGKGFSVSRPEDSICYRCHDKQDEGKFVHGPLAGGACAICHEPHGSSRKFFLKGDPLVICTSCHDQNLSRMHIEASKNKNCDKCHNPHSSDREFFLKLGVR